MIVRTTPSDIVGAITSELAGTVVSATIDVTPVGFTLHVAEDDVDPTLGTQTGADGAFSVVLTWGESSSRLAADGLDFSSISRWRWPVTVRVSYDVGGVRPEVRTGVRPQFEQAVVNAVRTALMPTAGQNWTLVPSSMRIYTQRHQTRSSMYVITMTLEVEGWY